MPRFAKQIVDVISQVAGQNAALHVPEITGNEWAYVKECLDTEWVSTAGSYVTKFEETLAEICRADYAVACINGTAALQICLQTAGVTRNDEVIVPSLTFVATSNAVAYCGAIPHFVDVEPKTMGLDPVKLEAHLNNIGHHAGGHFINRETGRRIAAVMCMHTFGHPARLSNLVEVCDRFSIPLIEDAAEALGSQYKGKHVGTVGKLSALSFNGNKIVTSGGGGAVLTNDPALAKRARHLSTTAKIAHKWEFIHDEVAYNYRMPNINAALGCAQLERLEDFVRRKRVLASKYENGFAGVQGLAFFEEPENCTSNYWLNVIILDESHAEMRDEVLDTLNDSGLMSRPAWRPSHYLAPFETSPKGDLSATKSLYRRLINIPSSPRLVA